jgi:hypothetical protein
MLCGESIACHDDNGQPIGMEAHLGDALSAKATFLLDMVLIPGGGEAKLGEEALAMARAKKGADIAAANFAQKTASRMFSSGGRFAGMSIDDVAGELKAGELAPKDVPIDVIVRDGNTLILNTRSVQALETAGIPRSEWTVMDRTGVAAYESRLTGQLTRNGLDSTGISSVRLTGGQ